MRCPFCGYEDTKVIDSRPTDSKKRRRRECTKCQKRFTTYESVELPLLMVQKKDGSFEPFSRNKLITGIYSAIKKRPVSVDAVSSIVDEIENKFANEFRNQTTSEEIGDVVLDKLRQLDVIAYIRFASVYKDFTDLDSFVKIISELDAK
ncbi:MAG: transcriptional regulator NrdR [Oscillospiraceae bacterium]|nr:transcriptional regulator NrdR [Oscillospiraceae bacterium]